MRGIRGMDKKIKPRLLSVIILTMFFFGCAETQKPLRNRTSLLSGRPRLSNPKGIRLLLGPRRSKSRKP